MWGKKTLCLTIAKLMQHRNLQYNFMSWLPLTLWLAVQDSTSYKSIMCVWLVIVFSIECCCRAGHFKDLKIS